MKPLNFLTLILLFVGFSEALAQTSGSNHVKRIRISEVYIIPGVFSQRMATEPVLNLKPLAPGSTFLNQDFTGYETSTGSGGGSGSGFSIMTGFQFRTKDGSGYRSGPRLRVGLTRSQAYAISGDLSKEERKPFDTLYSSQTGEPVLYRDSLKDSYYGVNYSYQKINLDASFIFRKNWDTRWTLFAGFGISAGFSTKAGTQVSFFESQAIAHRSSTNDRESTTHHSWWTYDGPPPTETFKNKMNFNASGYIPLGVEFKLSKKDNFFSRINLRYEARLGVTATRIPELKKIYAGRSTAHLVGISFSVR